MGQLKTLEEHRDYLYQIVRLKLFFLWQYQRKHPDEQFVKTLRERVDIFRKTAANHGMLNPAIPDYINPEWQELEYRLEKVYLNVHDSIGFENAGFDILQPSIDQRLERDYIDVSRINGYQCGSLRYDEFEPGTVMEKIGFHIANALQPDSMFTDPLYLPYCFTELMRQTADKYASTHLHTSTWLNSLPKWLKYFPQEYQDSLSPENTDVEYHYGFWGQFITARGTFNCKNGEYLRKNCTMPFLPRTAECSFKAMKAHLREKFQKIPVFQ